MADREGALEDARDDWIAFQNGVERSGCVGFGVFLESGNGDEQLFAVAHQGYAESRARTRCPLFGAKRKPVRPLEVNRGGGPERGVSVLLHSVNLESKRPGLFEKVAGPAQDGLRRRTAA